MQNNKRLTKSPESHSRESINLNVKVKCAIRNKIWELINGNKNKLILLIVLLLIYTNSYQSIANQNMYLRMWKEYCKW